MNIRECTEQLMIKDMECDLIKKQLESIQKVMSEIKEEIRQKIEQKTSDFIKEYTLNYLKQKNLKDEFVENKFSVLFKNNRQDKMRIYAWSVIQPKDKRKSTYTIDYDFNEDEIRTIDLDNLDNYNVIMKLEGNYFKCISFVEKSKGQKVIDNI